MLVIVLIIPTLLVVEFIVNSAHAWSLKSQLRTVQHPQNSRLLSTDWSVANCGGASNQCCYASFEFRTSVDSVEEIERWYTSLIGEPDLRKNENYELFFMNDDWQIARMHSFFEKKHDTLFTDPPDRQRVYSIAYIESGQPSGEDIRCH